MEDSKKNCRSSEVGVLRMMQCIEQKKIPLGQQEDQDDLKFQGDW